MRGIIEQVDLFIEGLADGSIISILSIIIEKDPHSISKFSFGNEKTDDDIVDELKNLYEILIPNYLKADPPSKEIQATKIFNEVLKCRVAGIFRNNPDNLKELSFFRNRCEKIETEKQKLEEKVADLSSKVLALTSPPDPKVGTH